MSGRPPRAPSRSGQQKALALRRLGPALGGKDDALVGGVLVNEDVVSPRSTGYR
jgi:hypothetical protein